MATSPALEVSAKATLFLPSSFVWRRKLSWDGWSTPTLFTLCGWCDDFLEATSTNCHNIHQLLVSYGELSVQVFSPNKSSIFYSAKTLDVFKRHMHHRSSICTGSLPFMYLGVPIFRGMLKKSHLNVITDNIIAKFLRWKGHTLSLAGQRCYINSVIASSLVHTMMVYKWPSSPLKRVESAIRNYLWTEDITKRGTNNVNWARCCAPMDEGGFGVRSIRLANATFTCKFVWDIIKGDGPSIILHNRYF